MHLALQLCSVSVVNPNVYMDAIAGKVSCYLWKALGEAAGSYDINVQSGGLPGICGGENGHRYASSDTGVI